MKQLTAEKEKLDASYRQLERDHLDLLDKELFKTNSRRLISFQLLVLDSCLLSDKNAGRAPMLEILGINSLGPLHQGRELIRDILTSKESGGYGAKTRILWLDPDSKAFSSDGGRMASGSKDTSRSSSARPKNCSRNNAMWEDPVVEAVRKVRDAHAAQFDYELQAIYRALKKEEVQSGLKFVRLPRKLTDSAAHPRSE